MLVQVTTLNGAKSVAAVGVRVTLTIREDEERFSDWTCGDEPLGRRRRRRKNKCMMLYNVF